MNDNEVMIRALWMLAATLALLVGVALEFHSGLALILFGAGVLAFMGWQDSRARHLR